MASFEKINDFVEHLAEGAHDLDTHQLTVAMSNTNPTGEGSNPKTDGNGLLANVTQVSYTYCSSRDITLSASSQTSGVYKLVLVDLTLSASGGAVGPMEWFYIYNSGTGVLTNPLICVFDYGSAVTLNDGEDLDIDFDGTNGLFQIT